MAPVIVLESEKETTKSGYISYRTLEFVAFLLEKGLNESEVRRNAPLTAQITNIKDTIEKATSKSKER